MKGPCVVQGCTRPGERAAQLCEAHRWRLRQHGDVQADKPIRTPLRTGHKNAPCVVEGCGRRRSANRSRLCPAHRHRLNRHGDVRADVPVRASEARAARYRPTLIDLEDTDEL